VGYVLTCCLTSNLLAQMPPGMTNSTGDTNGYDPYSGFNSTPVYTYPTNATLKWYLVMSYPPSFGSLSLAPDGTIYIPNTQTPSGFLTAVDTSAVNTNDINYPSPIDFTKWTATNSNYGGESTTPVVGPDGTIYAASGLSLATPDLYANDTISAINPTSGKVLWTFPVDFIGEGYPLTEEPQLALGNDGTIFAAGNAFIYALTNAFGVTNYQYADTNLYSCLLTNVGIKWIIYNTSNYFNWSAPVVGADGSIYEVGYDWQSDVTQLFAFNPTNGSQKWTSSPKIPNGFPSTPIIGSDGTIYYGAENYFIAINPNSAITNGIIGCKWAYCDMTTNSDGLTDDSFSCNPVIGPAGTIYAEVGDGYSWNGGTNKLFAINPATGIPKWIINLGNQSSYNELYWKLGCLAVASDGEIYLADGNGMIYSFSPDGTTNWTCQTDVITGGEALCSPLIGPDGTIYVETDSKMEQHLMFLLLPDPHPLLPVHGLKTEEMRGERLRFPRHKSICRL